MLEVRYNKNTKELTGWWGSRFDNHEVKLKNRPSEAIVTLDIPLPNTPLEAWLYSEATQSLVPNPGYIEPEPPCSTHVSTLEAIYPGNARPASIKRVWEGRDYFYDCFVTETVKDEYVAGDIQVGDYVIVHFDDIGEQIVTAKVYKSWA